MITLAGTLIGIGGTSGDDRTAEVQLISGAVVQIGGLAEKHCRELCHSLFEPVVISIETRAEFENKSATPDEAKA